MQLLANGQAVSYKQKFSLKPDAGGTGLYDGNSIVCKMRESGFPDDAAVKEFG
jgi:hypothetical protein